MPIRAAFLDVDGTLIRPTSMFQVVEAHLDRLGLHERYRRVRAELEQMTGASREQRNRSFYRVLRDQLPTEVADTAVSWFTASLRSGGLFHDEVLRRLREHRDAGDLVVLVSGSFPAALQPVREHVGADLVVCTRPLISPPTTGGRYTGAVDRPMIGQAKADALRRVAARHGISLSRSWAYGDHVSDLPMLAAVGCPVVVGEDAALASSAGRRGWDRIPSAGAVPPVSTSAASYPAPLAAGREVR